MKSLSVLLFTLAVICTFFLSQPGYAVDPDKQWVAECRQRAEQRIRSYESGVKKVHIYEDSLEKIKSTDTKKVLKGKGKFSTYSDQWKDFTFKCVYDKDDKEVAKVSYDVKGYSSGYNGGQSIKKGECKLWNTKEDYLDMESNCRVVREESGGKKEYLVTFNNGKEFRFIQQGSSYKVRMPKEWSDHPGYVTDKGSKSTFDWGKWKIVFKEY